MKSLLRSMNPKLKERALNALDADLTSAQDRKRLRTTLYCFSFVLGVIVLLGTLSFFTAAVARADDNLPLCEAGQEYDAGLCYDPCSEGYSGVGPVCWERCPVDFIDDGAFCRKNAVITAKDSYGRGAGEPMTCASTEELDGALCYPLCNDGYSGEGPVCWQSCPTGYTDTGLFCRKNGTTITKASFPATQTCPSGYTNVAGVCWQNCPANYDDTGAFCEPQSFAKHTYVVFPAWAACDAGYTNVAGVCWQNCPAGYADGGTFCRYDASTFAKATEIATYTCTSDYTHVAGICWQNCPAGYVDTGAFCEPESIPQVSYGRGAGVPVHTCADGMDEDGLLCYPKCDLGFVGVGPVCWKTCPADTIDDGAFCRKDAIITAKDTYGRGAGIVPNCDINNLNCAQNFETSINFRPQPWGYNFANWGGTTYDASTDFDNATLIRMFGSGVCQSGSTAQDCVLSASARAWRTAQLQAVAGGHCYGLAVGGQRFFAELDLAGNYESGAEKTYDLSPSASVRANITELARTQSLQPADGSSDGFIKSGAPSVILNQIRTQLRNMPSDPYVLAIFANNAGHAVTPFAIEDRGGGIFRLHVYDNNWPNAHRYIVFDTINESWLYGFGSTNPAEPVGAWSGGADSLWLRPTSAHLVSNWKCTFCTPGAAVNASSNQALNEIELSLMGEGRLTVINAQQKAVGWDNLTRKIVNQIEGAEFVPDMTGSGLEANPLIRLPIADLAPVSVIASSTDITRVVKTNLIVTAPGYAIGLTDLTITPGQTLSMTVLPNGRQISFQSSDSTISPDIYFAGEQSGDGNSYRFDLAGFDLSVGKIVTVTLDTRTGQLLVSDNDSKESAYDLEILRITPQGQEQNFLATDLKSPGESTSAIDFAGWDGSSTIDVTVDGQTTSVDNELAPEESNKTPVTVRDTATITRGAAVTVSVLTNDRDPNGDALTITSVSKPKFGTATTDGRTITYTPNANFVGKDSFTYIVSDGKGGAAAGAVEINVIDSTAPQLKIYLPLINR